MHVLAVNVRISASSWFHPYETRRCACVAGLVLQSGMSLLCLAAVVKPASGSHACLIAPSTDTLSLSLSLAAICDKEVVCPTSLSSTGELAVFHTNNLPSKVVD